MMSQLQRRATSIWLVFLIIASSQHLAAAVSEKEHGGLPGGGAFRAQQNTLLLPLLFATTRVDRPLPAKQQAALAS
jgi:hypothetical protein